MSASGHPTVTITYIDVDDGHRVVEARVGLSVMEAAVRNNVPGIDADCGGACACATCHVYVDEAWLGAIGSPEVMEQSMLEFAEAVTPNSRLSCQVVITAALDGLVVRTPLSQL